MRNRLDSLVYSVDKSFNENKAKLDPGDIGNVESALADARKALEAGGAENMNQAAERLQQASGASLTLDPSLQERNFGDVRGQPYATRHPSNNDLSFRCNLDLAGLVTSMHVERHTTTYRRY